MMRHIGERKPKQPATAQPRSRGNADTRMTLETPPVAHLAENCPHASTASTGACVMSAMAFPRAESRAFSTTTPRFAEGGESKGGKGQGKGKGGKGRAGGKGGKGGKGGGRGGYKVRWRSGRCQRN
jgi:hypothetical protein